MEAIVDAIIAELTLFKDTASASGGCSDILEIEALYWGDPGSLPINAYPAIVAQPVNDRPDIETTGYEVRNFAVLVTVLINAKEYFDAEPLEATGDRQLTQVIEALRNWFRTDHNRSLSGLLGVREVVASGTDYMVQVRGSVIAKSAQVTLTVNKQRQRQT
jgi:hypothetical protein